MQGLKGWMGVTAGTVRLLGFSSALAVAIGTIAFGTSACGQPPSLAPAAPKSAFAKCSEDHPPARPLIVEWPSADRATLEARMSRGLVVVHYKGCGIEVLARCNAPSAYAYTPTTPKLDRITMRNAHELYANVPLGAASLEGKLAQAGQLNVQMTIVGRYESERNFVRADQLSGDCSRATHVITGLTTGAFELSAGSSGEAGGGAHLGSAGAGGHMSESQETLNRDGDPNACASSKPGDKNPPAGCGALLRIEVAAIGDSAAPTCPEGSTYNGVECVRSQVLTVAECPPATHWDGRACIANAAPPPVFPTPTPTPVVAAPAPAPAPAVVTAAAPAATPMPMPLPAPTPAPAATPAPPPPPPPSPATRFAFVEGGVQDGRSGLVWERRDAPHPLPWDDASAHCRRGGNRLPTQAELSEVISADASSGALALDHGAHYWSSSQWSVGSIRYLAVNVATGNVKNEFGEEHHRVRCVRKAR
jgi:hypothetical protein